MRAGLHPVSGLSAHSQGDVSRWWLPHTPLPLCPYPLGRAHYLAAPVHDVSRRLHGPPALRLTLSFHATGGGPQGFVGDAWWTQFGVVCRHLPYLPHGPLSLGLRVWLPESGHGADTMWITPALLCPGR